MCHGDFDVTGYQVSYCHNSEVLRDLFLVQHVVYSVAGIYSIGSVSGQDGWADLDYQALGISSLLLGVGVLLCGDDFGGLGWCSSVGICCNLSPGGLRWGVCHLSDRGGSWSSWGWGCMVFG